MLKLKQIVCFGSFLISVAVGCGIDITYLRSRHWTRSAPTILLARVSGTVLLRMRV